MLKHYTLIVLIFIFFTNIKPVLGQKDIKPGFIITNTSDTVYGFINEKSSKTNSRICLFYNALNSEPISYNPFDIYAYRIDNEKFYVSKRILLNNDSTDIFLEYLVKGIVSLYYLKNNSEELYFIEKEGIMYPLSNDDMERISSDKTRTYQVKSNQYKRILNYLFQESPQLTNKINQTAYSLKPLITIVEDYHNNVCNDYSCINYTRNTKINVFVEPQIGIIKGYMKMVSAKEALSDIEPAVGIRFHFTSRFIKSQWNSIIGINYSQNHFEGIYENTFFAYGYLNQVDVKYSLLRIPLGIEYTLSTKKVQPSIFVAYNNVIILNPDYTLINWQVPYAGALKKVDISYETTFGQYQIGIMGGLGLKYNIGKSSYLHLNGNFEFRSPLTKTGNYFDYQKIYSMMFNLGYCIKI